MELISLVDEEPAFAEGLDERGRRQAERRLHVPSVTLSPGPWHPPAEAGVKEIGFFVVEGLLLRRVLVGSGRSLELLARGDCILPAREDAVSFAEAEWHAAERTVLALLDLRRGSTLSAWPALATTLTTKSVDRSRRLALQSAIMSVVGVEERLHALLWVLAERWGRVGPEGVEVEVKLPQNVLAEMVGARRPTVSQALGTLGARGVIVSRGNGIWLLTGEPPKKSP